MFPQGGKAPFGPFMNRGGYPPYQSFPANQFPTRGAGGLLSKFFQKKGGVTSFPAPTTGHRAGFLSNLMSNNGTATNFGTPSVGQGAGGFLSNLISNPESASGILTNIQKVINVANQMAPMVQQYGPMVKNIPALISLYKEINSSDDDSMESSEKPVPKEHPIPTTNKKIETPKSIKGDSKPKLYI